MTRASYLVAQWYRDTTIEQHPHYGCDFPLDANHWEWELSG